MHGKGAKSIINKKILIILVSITAILIVAGAYARYKSQIKMKLEKCIKIADCDNYFGNSAKSVSSSIDCINKSNLNISIEEFIKRADIKTCGEMIDVDMNGDGRNEYVLTGSESTTVLFIGELKGKLKYLILNPMEIDNDKISEDRTLEQYWAKIYAIFKIKGYGNAVVIQSDMGGMGRFHHYAQQIVIVKDGNFTEISPPEMGEYSFNDIDKDGYEEIIVHAYEDSNQTVPVDFIFKYENGKFVETGKFEDYIARRNMDNLNNK
jgi:hypothetical protein